MSKRRGKFEPSTSASPKRDRYGLVNPSVSCFVNSGAQLLYDIEELRNKIMKIDKFVKDEDKFNDFIQARENSIQDRIKNASSEDEKKNLLKILEDDKNIYDKSINALKTLRDAFKGIQDGVKVKGKVESFEIPVKNLIDFCDLETNDSGGLVQEDSADFIRKIINNIDIVNQYSDSNINTNIFINKFRNISKCNASSEFIEEKDTSYIFNIIGSLNNSSLNNSLNSNFIDDDIPR